MDIVDIRYIDTSELDGYIRESLKRWDQTKSNFADSVTIVSKRIWKDDLSTRAAYYCNDNEWTTLMIYVEYNEVEMAGRIEMEHFGPSSETTKQDLKEIMTEVVGSFEPLLAPLPFGVKCPHCGAKYVYKTRTGTVDCQNCAKPFDLEFQEESTSLQIQDNDKLEPSGRYIALDRRKIAYCTWCGTAESSQWVSGNLEKIYCSMDCVYADRLEMNSMLAFCSCLIPFFCLLLFVPIIAQSQSGYLALLPFLVTFGLLPLVFIYLIFRGKSIRASRPKNSRMPK